MTVYQDREIATTLHKARRNAWALLGLAMLAVACVQPARQPTPPAPQGPSPAAPTVPHPLGARLLQIVPTKSELVLFVYREGPMAALGHNHVIVNRQLSGTIWLAPRSEDSQFELAVPSAQFSVDEPELRRAAGEDFAKEVLPEARTGTLRNMLSPALLNAAAFPQITVRSVRCSAGPSGWHADLAVEVAGHSSRVTAAFIETQSADQVEASGEFEMRQSQLGLKPFSVMLGVLAVRDEMRVRFKIVARPDRL
jgi:YceI-like domain